MTTEAGQSVMMTPQGATPQLYARLAPRLWALLIDGVVLMALVFALMVGAIAGGPGAQPGVLVAVVLVFNLYDPLLVSLTGSTLGHRALNLRVVRIKDGHRINLGAALIRWWLKWLLGLVSFAFVLTTRKHQSLHDLATGSILMPRDPDLWRDQFDVERLPPADMALVSARRRVLVTVGYGLAATVGLFGATGLVLSDPCLTQDVCSTGEELLSRLFGMLWLVGLSFIIVFGWRARLPGARVGRAARAGHGASPTGD